MKTTVFRWMTLVAAALSTTWVILLTALVFRCKLSGEPFPVMAKFSTFAAHRSATDHMLLAFPWLALAAVAFMALTCYYERSFRAVRKASLVLGVSALVSFSILILNPGNYVSWLMD